MVLERLVVGPLEVNCYILGCPQSLEAIVIDPGAEPERIRGRLRDMGLKLAAVVNTHGHVDHIGADSALGVPVYIHRQDAEFLRNPQLSLAVMWGMNTKLPRRIVSLEDEQSLSAGTIDLRVIHTPGHTPGGICLDAGAFVFTGDTLFARGVGRTDLPGSCEEDLLASIRRRLFTLPENTVIYPGHGCASTIGTEKRGSHFI